MSKLNNTLFTILTVQFLPLVLSFTSICTFVLNSLSICCLNTYLLIYAPRFIFLGVQGSTISSIYTSGVALLGGSGPTLLDPWEVLGYALPLLNTNSLEIVLNFSALPKICRLISIFDYNAIACHKFSIKWTIKE